MRSSSIEGPLERNLLTQWSRLLVASLQQAGVGHVWISPGSRSTPLVAAVLDSGLGYTVAIDERSAAFAALGMTKASGTLCVLVCTSGSALGHYLPALIEADESRTPLLVLSADRPVHLQGSRAPQTIDQTHLFGSKVRAFMDLGLPQSSERALRALRRKAVHAVALCRGPVPGPVHLNFPADKPLEPHAAVRTAELALETYVTGLLGRGMPRVHSAEAPPSEMAVSELLEMVRCAERPVLSVGPVAARDAPAVRALYRAVARAGWPVFAETTSQLRLFAAHDPLTEHGQQSENAPLAATQQCPDTRCDGVELLYRSVATPALVPDFVLHVGSPLTSARWHRLLDSHPTINVALVAGTDWPDPEDRASLVLACDPLPLAAALDGRLPRVAREWYQQLAAASARARECCARVASDPELPFADPSVFRALDRVLENGDQLLLGNSLPVRLADTWLSQSGRGANERTLRCVSQRGANGIDGLISLAVGASTGFTGHSVLVLGDVSALHDLSALSLLGQHTASLTVLVINNQGGRIFEQLPIAETVTATDAWITPHALELWRLGAVFGIPSRLAESEQSVELALRQARAAGGPAWIEARVAADGARRWSVALESELDQAFAANG